MSLDTFFIVNRLADRLRLGVHLYSGISLMNSQGLDAHIHNSLASIRQANPVSPPPGHGHSRKLYRSFHIDPTRLRPSSEALWRRFHGSGEFPRIHPLVDLTNLLSLKFQVCFGLYDLDRIEGEVTLRMGEAQDQYTGIRKEILSLLGKPVLKDSRSAFGNPSADSLRTAVNEKSENILQVLFFHPSHPSLENIHAETADDFRRFFSIVGWRSFWV